LIILELLLYIDLRKFKHFLKKEELVLDPSSQQYLDNRVSRALEVSNVTVAVSVFQRQVKMEVAKSARKKL
jgi:hypothetical protein